MKKDSFYICVQIDGKVTAQKRTGYSDGNLGVYKQCGTWIVTYIPTGQKIPISGNPKTAKGAIKEARKQIEQRSDFRKLVEDAMKSDFYEEFQRSRYEKTVTYIF